jgi:lipopolysaccharide/colanic/teichoic acid biosynthesis glycosyltransferase
MSVIGPRPTLPAQVEEYTPRQRGRLQIKPGITGWAQVNGHRGETDTIEKMQCRFECDIHYIDNWSFLLDLKIILMTLFSRAAYRNAF